MSNVRPRVLLAIQNPTLCEVYASNLKVYLNIEAYKVHDTKKINQIISQKIGFHIVITQEEINEASIFSFIYKKFRQINPKTRFFLMGAEELSRDFEEGVQLIKDFYDLKSLLGPIAKMSGITAQDMAKLKVPPLFPFPAKLFISNFDYEVDIWIKREQNFQKLLYKGQVFVGDQIKDLMQDYGDDTCFYVDCDERIKFIDKATTGFIDYLKSSNLNLSTRNKLTQSAQEVIQEMVSNIGIEPSTVQLAEAGIESLMTVVKDSGPLSKVVQSMINDKLSYRYMHSMLNLYIGTRIIETSRWGNQEQVNKFAYVCFLHDITLKKDEWAKFHSDEEIDHYPGLSDQEKNRIKRHSLLAAKIVAKFKKFPIGVEVLLKQHHGNTSGTSLKLNSFNLSPLAIIFIIAEEYSKVILETRTSLDKLDKTEFMERMLSKYDKGKFPELIKQFGFIDFEKISNQRSIKLAN